MDPFVFFLAGLAIAVPLIAKSVFHHSICWKEWAAQMIILSVVLIGVFALARGAQTSDVRIVNGELLRKARHTAYATELGYFWGGTMVKPPRPKGRGFPSQTPGRRSGEKVVFSQQ